jgi:antitoxin (DNA-binding transcriptional repressor) of toxin-antitoxin stability system
MKRLDVQELLDVRELLDKQELQELKERINKILRMFEEDETVEVIDHGKVIAHVVPVSEPKQSVEQRDAAAWADLRRIASELAPYWPDKNIDAVEIVRDVRRDLQ